MKYFSAPFIALAVIAAPAQSERLGTIWVKLDGKPMEFPVHDTFSGGDTSWGSMVETDRNFQMVGEHPGGARFQFSVVYEDESIPFLWVTHIKADGTFADGGSSEGMSVRIKRYKMIPQDQALADIRVTGSFEGPIHTDDGVTTSVKATFDARLPHVEFSISLPQEP